MLDPVIAETLGAGARVFCLVASPDTIVARVLNGPVRPLLAGPDPRARIAAAARLTRRRLRRLRAGRHRLPHRG